MTDRYAKYTSFEFDHPSDRVLRITLNNPKTYNSLDAAEEARILPELKIKISKVKGEKNVLELCVEDNGPGIPRSSLEKVFGRLLFGSRFHSIRQTRGQQGIGITGVVMYGQLTTGKPTNVVSNPSGAGSTGVTAANSYSPR